MQDIELTFPVGLSLPGFRDTQISLDSVHRMAIELHEIVAAYRQLFAVRPPCGCLSTTRRPISSRRCCGPP
jgi:hypothetical protein